MPAASTLHHQRTQQQPWLLGSGLERAQWKLERQDHPHGLLLHESSHGVESYHRIAHQASIGHHHLGLGRRSSCRLRTRKRDGGRMRARKRRSSSLHTRKRRSNSLRTRKRHGSSLRWTLLRRNSSGDRVLRHLLPTSDNGWGISTFPDKDPCLSGGKSCQLAIVCGSCHIFPREWFFARWVLKFFLQNT